MSVNSSIYNYVEENGRTYHRYKEGSKFYKLRFVEILVNELQNICYRMMRLVVMYPKLKSLVL